MISTFPRFYFCICHGLDFAAASAFANVILASNAVRQALVGASQKVEGVNLISWLRFVFHINAS
jgi:hypothetical protein